VQHCGLFVVLRTASGRDGINPVLLLADYPFVLGEHHPGKLIESMADQYEQSGATPAKGEVNMDRYETRAVTQCALVLSHNR
jgi:hypothetical protein